MDTFSPTCASIYVGLPIVPTTICKINQPHSCGDNALSDFFNGKSEFTLSLFWLFVEQYQQIGNITIHPTKSIIGFAAITRIAHVIKLERNFVDIVLPFTEPHNDNWCFQKLAQVPGACQYNHHFRMCNTYDINDRIFGFMKLAYDKRIVRCY